MASADISLSTTSSDSTTSGSTAEHSKTRIASFYKKSCAAGEVTFISNGAIAGKVPFVKTNASTKDRNHVLDDLAEIVLNKLPYLHRKSLLLSITDDAIKADYRESFRSLKKILPGTCLVTGGKHDGIYNVKDIVGNSNNDQDKCPAIGIVNWNHVRHLFETVGVFGIDSDGDVFVTEASGERWTLDAALLTEDNIPINTKSASSRATPDIAAGSSPPPFANGDLVQICSDLKRLKFVQGNLWSDDMERTLGKFGIIQDSLYNGDLRLHVCGCKHKYNPKAVTLVNLERLTALLKKHFEDHQPGDLNDELVLAVRKDDASRVGQILKTVSFQTCTYKGSSNNQQGQTTNESNLDDKHDLFVFAYDSTLRDFGDEIEFRYHLERKLALYMFNRKKSETKAAMPIPIIKLRIRGDIGEIRWFPKSIENYNTSMIWNGDKLACEQSKEDIAEMFKDTEPRRIYLKDLGLQIADVVVDYYWSAHIVSRTELSKLAMGFTMDSLFVNNLDFSHVVTYALINDRVDFVELLIEMDNCFLRMFPIHDADFRRLSEQRFRPSKSLNKQVV